MIMETKLAWHHKAWVRAVWLVSAASTLSVLLPTTNGFLKHTLEQPPLPLSHCDWVLGWQHSVLFLDFMTELWPRCTLFLRWLCGNLMFSNDRWWTKALKHWCFRYNMTNKGCYKRWVMTAFLHLVHWQRTAFGENITPPRFSNSHCLLFVLS